MLAYNYYAISSTDWYKSIDVQWYTQNSVQHLLYSSSLTPIYPRVNLLQPLYLLYLNEAIYQDSQNTTFRYLIKAIKQIPCLSPYSFSHWLRGCMKVGLD